MRIRCYGCTKSVSSEVPEDTVLRAVAICPECIEAGWTPDSPSPFFSDEDKVKDETPNPD